jgi:hypothetical protein
VANVRALIICSGPTSLPALEIATALRGSLAKQATRSPPSHPRSRLANASAGSPGADSTAAKAQLAQSIPR